MIILELTTKDCLLLQPASEAATRCVLYKKVFLIIQQNLFSCEFSENKFFTEHIRTTASATSFVTFLKFLCYSSCYLVVFLFRFFSFLNSLHFIFFNVLCKASKVKLNKYYDPEPDSKLQGMSKINQQKSIVCAY